MGANDSIVITGSPHGYIFGYILGYTDKTRSGAQIKEIYSNGARNIYKIFPQRDIVVKCSGKKLKQPCSEQIVQESSAEKISDLESRALQACQDAASQAWSNIHSPVEPKKPSNVNNATVNDYKKAVKQYKEEVERHEKDVENFKAVLKICGAMKNYALGKSAKTEKILRK